MVADWSAVMTLEKNKHQKRRNIGLMYEFIVRHIIDCVLKDDDAGAQRAVAVIKKNFKPGTELYREWRLFNAVVKTQGVDETMANAIIRETRHAVRKYDKKKLEQEKTKLIHEVNHRLGQDVYTRPVANYKFFATVQTLFNDWRDSNVPNISRIAEYEKQLQETLMSVPEIIEEVVESDDPGGDALVIKLMAEKLNKRYVNKLNPVQRSLLNLYALEGVSDKLVENFSAVKSETLTKLDKYRDTVRSGNDEYTLRKLDEAYVAISELNAGDMNDSNVARFLKLCELKDELEHV